MKNFFSSSTFRAEEHLAGLIDSTVIDACVIKKGLVLERKIGRFIRSRVSWSSKFLCLDNTKLYYLQVSRSGGSLEPHVLCDTMFASIKELRDVPFAFTICDASKAGLLQTTIKCSGELEYAEWVKAIRHAIEHRLASPLRMAGVLSDEPTRARRIRKRREDMVSVIEAITTLNSQCVDCGGAGPEWVLLNHGALVCIHCSGVHRSFGAHVTKVRSIVLDDLEPLEYQFLLQVGNNVHNDIWEGQGGGKLCDKPSPSDSEASSSQARQVYVRAKYVDKCYLNASMHTLCRRTCCLYESYNDMMIDACRYNDIHTATLAVANGADVNCTAVDEKGVLRTCLEIAAMLDHRSIVVLLIVNGFCLDESRLVESIVTSLTESNKGEIAEYIAAKAVHTSLSSTVCAGRKGGATGRDEERGGKGRGKKKSPSENKIK